MCRRDADETAGRMCGRRGWSFPSVKALLEKELSRTTSTDICLVLYSHTVSLTENLGFFFPINSSFFLNGRFCSHKGDGKKQSSVS